VEPKQHVKSFSGFRMWSKPLQDATAPPEHCVWQTNDSAVCEWICLEQIQRWDSPTCRTCKVASHRDSSSGSKCHDGTDATRPNGLAAHLAAMQALDNKTVLRVNCLGTAFVTVALHEFAVLSPQQNHTTCEASLET